MKITLFLSMLTIFQLWATDSYSQLTKLTLKLENSTIADALKEIENQSEFFFLYSPRLIDVDRKVNVTAKNESIRDILTDIFQEDVAFKVFDRQIILTPNELAGQIVEIQQRRVTGTVTDKEGAPLPGVNVFVTGTSQGTTTDAAGQYSIEVPDGARSLTFSYIGMEPQEIIIGTLTVINVSMAESAIGLDEVVVVGYGTQKSGSMTGSVSVVSAEELNKRPVNNAALMLQGKVPGIQIIQNSGQPGAEGALIQIRGLTSYGSSNAPLVLVDGIAGSLTNLDPEMIASISVLKDASSAAIYGSRASNGVILVTTKQGSKERLSIEYHYNYGVHNFTRIPDMINNSAEYMTLINEAMVNSRGAGKALYTQAEIDAYRNNVGNPEYPNTNWEDLTFRTGGASKHFLSLSGGKSGTTYYLGLSYLDQTGCEQASGLKKYNVLLNLNSQLNKFVTLKTNFNFTNADFYGNDISIASYASKPLRGAYMPGDNTRYSARSYAKEYNNANPVMALEQYQNRTTGYEGILSSALEIKLMENLTWETTGSLKANFDKNKINQSKVPTYDWHTGDFVGYNTPYTNVSITESQNVLYTFFSTLKYDKLFAGKHQVNGLLGYNQESYNWSNLSAYRRNLPNNTITQLNAAGTEGQTNGGTATEWAIRSFFGRANYAFRDKYLLEASFRYDGSSRFSEGNKWGLFPSFSAGWRVTEEAFMKKIPVISRLKLRASWGSLGNQQIGNYPYQEVYSLGLNYPMASIAQPGAYVASLNNNEITWEKTTIADLGLDFGFFDNKIYGTFDWFDKLTSDILRSAQVPRFVGLSAPTVNGGKMKNTGFEISIGHMNTIGDFKYDVNFNLGHYKNTTVDFGKRQINSETIIEEGLPWDSYYLLNCIGIFQSQEEIAQAPVHQYNPKPGDLRYEDISGPNGVPDGKIDQNDRTLIEGRYPKFDYGSSLSVSWKNFDLSAFVQGSYGRKMSISLWGYEPFFQEGRAPTIWRDRWTPENPSTTMPRLYMPGEAPAIKPSSETTNSTFWLQDASYIRLKNVQLGYNIPSKICNKIGAQSIHAYFSGDNLFTITKFYEGGDPERGAGGRFGIYGQIRILSLGARIIF